MKRIVFSKIKTLFKIILIFTLFTSCVNKDNIWIGRSIVFNNGVLEEFNLYNAKIENMDNAINKIINTYWENISSMHEITFSENRSEIRENNIILSDNHKNMMKYRNSNISTISTTHVGGAIFLRFYVYYTIDFEIYSLWITEGEIHVNDVWGNVNEYFEQREMNDYIESTGMEVIFSRPISDLSIIDQIVIF